MLNKLNSALVGGLVAGIATSICCAGPLILLSLGISGAWISNLTMLEPYRPVFIVLSVTMLIFAYLQIYTAKDKQVCETGKACAEPKNQRLYKGIFLSVAVIVLIFIVSPYLILLIYE